MRVRTPELLQALANYIINVIGFDQFVRKLESEEKANQASQMTRLEILSQHCPARLIEVLGQAEKTRQDSIARINHILAFCGDPSLNTGNYELTHDHLIDISKSLQRFLQPADPTVRVPRDPRSLLGLPDGVQMDTSLFLFAAENAWFELIQYWWNREENPLIRNAWLSEDDGIIFFGFIRRGHIKMLHWLQEVAGEDFQNMFDAHHESVHQIVFEEGHLEILRWYRVYLGEEAFLNMWAGEGLGEANDDYEPLCQVGMNEHLHIVQWLFESLPPQPFLRLVCANQYILARASAHSEGIILRWLKKICPLNFKKCFPWEITIFFGPLFIRILKP